MKAQLHRHGDVMLKPIRKKAPMGCKMHEGECTIALGEATGHHHTLYEVTPSKSAPVVKEWYEGDRRFVQVPIEMFLRHQEHAEQRIAPGTYEITMEREFDPFAKKMVRVID